MSATIDSQMPSNAGVGAEANGSEISHPRTISFNNAGGSILYVLVGLGVNTGGTTVFSGCTYNSVSMTLVAEQATVSGASRVGIYRLVNPATGTNNIVLDFDMTLGGAGNSNYWAGAISLSGVDLVNPELQSGGANGSDASPQTDLFSVNGTSYCLCAMGAGSTFSFFSNDISFQKGSQEGTQLGNGGGLTAQQSGTVSFIGSLPVSDSWAAMAIEVGAGSGGPVYPVSAVSYQNFKIEKLAYPDAA